MRLEQYAQKKAAEQQRKSTQQLRDTTEEAEDPEEPEESEDPREREEPANSSEQGTDKEDEELSDPDEGITEREEDNYITWQDTPYPYRVKARLMALGERSSRTPGVRGRPRASQ